MVPEEMVSGTFFSSEEMVSGNGVRNLFLVDFDRVATARRQEMVSGTFFS